jgi:hypothetical protein
MRKIYRLGRIAASICALRSAVRGNVAIEFGFIAPILILLTLGAVELGRLGTEWTRVKHAANAGTQFGIQDQSNAANTQGMIDAARLDADDTANELSITARRYCRCPGAASEGLCSEKCADDSFSPMYVEVNVSRNLAALIPYIELPKSYAISAQNTDRVR